MTANVLPSIFAMEIGDTPTLQVVTFEMLQQEEKNRQVATANLAGVAGAANAYSASRAGYGSYHAESWNRKQAIKRFPSLRLAKVTSRRESRCINGSTTRKTPKAPAVAWGIR
jgi:hypothetical protein